MFWLEERLALLLGRRVGRDTSCVSNVLFCETYALFRSGRFGECFFLTDELDRELFAKFL